VGPKAPKTLRSELLRRANGDVELAALRVSPTSSDELRVVIPRCGSAACAMQIRLGRGNVVVDELNMEAETSATLPQAIDESAGMIGSGDPLDGARQVRAWVVGEGEEAVTTYVEPLNIGVERRALLVHQLVGEEHTKRQHALFIADRDHIFAAWTGKERQGLTSSTVEQRDLDGDGLPEWLFWQFVLSADGGSIWQLDVVRWNSATQKAEAASFATGHLKTYAVVASVYPSVDDAQKALATHWHCLGAGFSVFAPLKSSAPDGLSGWSIAALTAHRELADHAAAAAISCGLPAARVVDLGAERGRADAAAD
jgi:hypothetical protein